jgi:hypothetical protein
MKMIEKDFDFEEFEKFEVSFEQGELVDIYHVQKNIEAILVTPLSHQKKIAHGIIQKGEYIQAKGPCH